MTKHEGGSRLWNDACEVLKGEIGDGAWKRWIEPLKFKGENASAAHIAAPSDFSADWVNRHYAETILAAPCSDPLKLGSPVYVEGLLAQPSWVAQNANLAIYLAKAGDHPWLFLVPKEAKVSERSGVTLVDTESVTLAIWPICLENPRENGELTETVQFREKKGEKSPRWSNSKVLSAKGTGAAFSGFAIEIAEGVEARKRLVEQAPGLSPEREELDVRGAIAFTGVGGKRLRLQTGDTLGAIQIWRDGKLRDWSDPTEGASFHVRSGDLEIRQDWGSGQLSVEVGGVAYRCRVGSDGQVSWE